MIVRMNIEDSFYYEAEEIGLLEGRSVEAQFEFWARVGQCIQDFPGIPTHLIPDFLYCNGEEATNAAFLTYSKLQDGANKTELDKIS